MFLVSELGQLVFHCSQRRLLHCRRFSRERRWCFLHQPG
jgi:hypothetical protein